jgi:hypothetical protein
MAQNDLVEVTGNASTASILRGVSSSYPTAPGAGSNCFAFESQDNGTGVVALYFTMVGCNPTSMGAQISAALQRGPSAGLISFAPFVFCALTNPNAEGVAYILGLGDSDPSHIVLRKGDLASGLPDLAPGTQGVLARSTATYPAETWYHLQLEVVLNSNGEVVICCYANDLTVNTVSSPVWLPIPGLASFIDDPLGVNSGSPPLTAGRMGIGFHSSDVARVGLIDYVVPLAQSS